MFNILFISFQYAYKHLCNGYLSACSILFLFYHCIIIVTKNVYN